MLHNKSFGIVITRLLTALVLVSMLALGFSLPAKATLNDGSTFNAGDGNLSLDQGEIHDWNSPVEPIVCPNTIPGSGTNCGTDLTKSTSDNAFGQGSKEDIPTPTVVFGSIPPNKSDLTRFYVNKEFINGKFFLYLAWERSNVLGSANLDFEINQVATPGSNGVTPDRTAGDLLITFDFTNGGGNPVLGQMTWLTSGSNSQCFSSNGTIPCWGDHVNLSAAGEAEGQVNTVTVHDGNPPPAGGFDLPGLTFGEAAVDLTDSGIFLPSVCEHFGSAFLKSRSSSSFSAELKDFIAPVAINISNCGNIIIRKVTVPSPDPTATSFAYTTTGGLTPSTFSLADGGNQDYGSAVLAGNYSVSETDPGPNFVLQSLDCSASSLTNGSSFSISGATVSIALNSGDIIDCTYTNQLQQGAIKITKTTTKGNAALPGATFSLSGPSGTFTLTSGSDGTVCKDGLLFGPYTVQEKTAPTGYAINDSTVHNVTVGTSTTCGSGSELPLSFSDTPLSKITVSFQSLAGLGVTTATIQCTGDASAAPLPEGTPKVLDNRLPGTYTCTVVVDP